MIISFLQEYKNKKAYSDFCLMGDVKHFRLASSKKVVANSFQEFLALCHLNSADGENIALPFCDPFRINFL